jgi:hypothetical protein
MGHSGDTMIFNHYRQAVTPAEAAKYWALEPGKPGKVVRGNLRSTVSHSDAA